MYRLMTHLDNALGIDLMATDFKTHIQSVGEIIMNIRDELEEKTTGQAEDRDQDPNIERIKEKEAPTKKEQKKKQSGTEKDDEEQQQVVGIKKKKKKKKKTALIRDDDADEAPIGTEARIVEAGEGEAVVEAKAGGLQNELEKISQVSAFVEQILNLYRRYNRMYVESFQKYTLFNDSIKAAFSEFLNRTPGEGKKQFEEYLAVYVDELMKSQAATAFDDQIKTRFDEICAVLQYVSNRDTFLKNNQFYLQNRILDQGDNFIAQEQVEREFILKCVEAGIG
ncbi:MAG: hypothetical protein EZS28_039414 [Streblomastix strix]|uniref:Cullin family profile domain-containing protein n=1 Tax=Streblomastix strix TaxID=222440 RepID=A0A5J4U3Y3_9EUKA|nr:MAG: hypothetical protein EZS28_039414 [Streblomastix strix]